MINALLALKNTTKYRLAKEAGLPNAISDIFSGKANLEKCTAKTLYRIAWVLQVSIEDLIRERMEDKPLPRSTFEIFKSNI